MATPHEGPDEGKLRDVQQKIDQARSRARDHGMVPDAGKRQEAHRDEEEEAIDGMTRPGLG